MTQSIDSALHSVGGVQVWAPCTSSTIVFDVLVDGRQFSLCFLNWITCMSLNLTKGSVTTTSGMVCYCVSHISYTVFDNFLLQCNSSVTGLQSFVKFCYSPTANGSKSWFSPHQPSTAEGTYSYKYHIHP